MLDEKGCRLQLFLTYTCERDYIHLIYMSHMYICFKHLQPAT